MTEFPIRLSRNLRPILILFGARPRHAFVRIDGDQLYARFGFYSARTTIANIERWDITGPYRWWRAVGVRATIGHRDLTFGGSAHGGVRLRFRELVPIFRVGFRELYLTTDDLEGFAAALTERGIPGADLRTRK